MITQMILGKVPADNSAEAERLWREDCGALLIEQLGGKSERFLRSRENQGEFISLSAWDNQDAIDRYRASDAHRTIQQHTRALMNVAKVEGKLMRLPDSRNRSRPKIESNRERLPLSSCRVANYDGVLGSTGARGHGSKRLGSISIS